MKYGHTLSFGWLYSWCGDDSGSIYVAGVTNGGFPWQLDMQGDAFIRKFDTAGNQIWHREFGDEWMRDRAYSVATDSTGVY